jgi:hypothetical protein
MYLTCNVNNQEIQSKPKIIICVFKHCNKIHGNESEWRRYLHTTLIMERVNSSETSVIFYQTVWRYTPKDNHLYLTCGLLRCAVNLLYIKVSEEYSASIFMTKWEGLERSRVWMQEALILRRWSQYFLTKLYYIPRNFFGARTPNKTKLI